MKLSTKSRYGTRFLLNLAEQYPDGIVQLREISENQEISLKYLEQIVIPLKKAKYIKSIRGVKGGYLLAKPPESIFLGDIVALFEGGPTIIDCFEKPHRCTRSSHCIMREVWSEGATAMYNKLNSISLAEVLRRVDASGGTKTLQEYC